MVRLLPPWPWLVLAPPSLPGRGSRHGYGINYADAASWLRSATAEVEAETGSHGLRIGRTSACTGARRSILPMTGLSGTFAADRETNLFSLRRRSINRSCHGRSTGCGREKKFRNVQIRYARCTRFGCRYRGPIGVSSSRTPRASFAIHMTEPTWGKMANFAFAMKRALLHLRRGNGK